MDEQQLNDLKKTIHNAASSVAASNLLLAYTISRAAPLAGSYNDFPSLVRYFQQIKAELLHAKDDG